MALCQEGTKKGAEDAIKAIRDFELVGENGMVHTAAAQIAGSFPGGYEGGSVRMNFCCFSIMFPTPGNCGQGKR